MAEAEGKKEGPVRRVKRRLTPQNLRAMGATPGLMARRYDVTGRTRLEQLAPEGPELRKDFVRRDTNATGASDERGPACPSGA